MVGAGGGGIDVVGANYGMGGRAGGDVDLDGRVLARERSEEVGEEGAGRW